MALDLPPISVIAIGEEAANFVRFQLTSVIAGHAGARTTYQFYEELDQWLGPWGTRGYPIGYGARYNIAFSSNVKLMRNPTTRAWVWRTTILLQEALRDYIVSRVRNGTISALTEPDLRQAAFNSHPLAYERGGLSQVVLVAPELIDVIATIPAAEFDPNSPNFGSTVRQVFQTLGLTAGGVTGIALATFAGPAHTGLLSRAMQRDRLRNSSERHLANHLGMIRDTLNRGELDHIPWLDQIERRLLSIQFPDSRFAEAASRVLLAVRERREYVRTEHARFFQGR